MEQLLENPKEKILAQSADESADELHEERLDVHWAI